MAHLVNLNGGQCPPYALKTKLQQHMELIRFYLRDAHGCANAANAGGVSAAHLRLFAFSFHI